MCFNKADECLKDIENRWIRADAAINFLEMGKSLAYWTEKSKQHLDTLLDYINTDDNLCCLDVYLRLSEDLVRMQQTYSMLHGREVPIPA